MARKKKVVEEYVPKEVRIKVRIEPAFKLVIESDDTGKSWNGHTWYGDTAMDTLRRMRKSLIIGPYGKDKIKVSSSTPELVPAVSWKEAILDSRNPSAPGRVDARPDERVVG